jgi:hypothetical protein
MTDGNAKEEFTNTEYYWAWTKHYMFKSLKYVFHVSVLYMFPMVQWRFFWRYDDFNMTAYLTLLFSATFSIVMAQWSYTIAEKGKDPGFVEWEDFRTP